VYVAVWEHDRRIEMNSYIIDVVIPYGLDSIIPSSLSHQERLFCTFILINTLLTLSIVNFDIISLRTTIMEMDDGLNSPWRCCYT